jgi:hypothetical protein
LANHSKLQSSCLGKRKSSSDEKVKIENGCVSCNNDDGECDGFRTVKRQYFYGHHRLGISLRYTFNASKSKYKGTGAGQAER